MKLEDFDKEIRDKLKEHFFDYYDARIDKQEAVNTQTYENAAMCRDRERVNITKIHNIIRPDYDFDSMNGEGRIISECNELFGVKLNDFSTLEELKSAIREYNIDDILNNK